MNEDQREARAERSGVRSANARARLDRHVGRVGEAPDVAEAYLYLMREGFSTGQVVTVDGGTVLV